jgi:hypothetical protein
MWILAFIRHDGGHRVARMAWGYLASLDTVVVVTLEEKDGAVPPA